MTGFTLTIGELREKLKDLPDDAELYADMGDLQFYEVRMGRVLPPVLDHPYAVSLELGQVCNFERDIDARIDAQLGD